jgi:alanyl-tRNA synthetase
MKATEIRQTFLDFFADRGHAVIPSAPLVPEHDPTVLFTTAGMHPLVPNFLGEPHPAGKRLVNVQKCIRTVDIDEVGDDSHATFLEMLGNWSLGDYFKEESIAWSWEFLTKQLKLDPARIAISVFAGDKDAPRDEEAAKLWEKVGVTKERVFYYGKDDNWWGPAGQTGPCGPDTEMFYWIGEGKPELKPGPAKDEQRWLEIWNNVFMEYEKTAEGNYLPLAQKNVDTGMGLERIAAVLQNKDSIYETDLFRPVTEVVQQRANKRFKETIQTDPAQVRATRIIADHLKAAVFIIADGVRPSNTERGYVLRRLIRRAIRQARLLEIQYPFTATVADSVITNYEAAYPELKREAATIRQSLLDEEAKFQQTLTKGLKQFDSTIRELSGIFSDGRKLFELFETYGFPFELSLEELKNRDVDFDQKTLAKEFESARKAHQEQSRAGAEQKFAGGLADHSEIVVRQHTATHLLLAALREVLGEQIKQRGSNITAERLRFDFSHPEKLSEEQINQVEALVNEWIKEDLPVTRQEMPREEAERLGAQMEFGHKYPDIVSVYFIGDPASARSMEFCGGPHVEHTGQIGQFKIAKQESVGAGVRRIKATIK